ncbi:unnamed protein product [Phytomonas sp. EM1]|nr:unnamed protein product [Phytomonas sp. EM1]|eukprot:CCW62337.1 unnamed protein product [Phytomonas sp. isolate EM1]
MEVEKASHGIASRSVMVSSSSEATPFGLVQRLLVSLLRYWPDTPDVSIPSVLLCGPPRVGKSYLIRTLHDSIDDGRFREGKKVDKTIGRSFITVISSLAPALAVRTRDGHTGLRRLLKRKMLDAIRESTGGDAASEKTVLLVLDHVEFLMASTEGQESSGIGNNDEVSCGQPATRHPALFADLYRLLRTPLGFFTREECSDLGLRRLVVVALFGGGFAERVHPFPRDRVFDVIRNLATPTEAERRVFFTSRLLSNPPGDRDGGGEARAFRLPLAAALAFRTGGMSYTALGEVATLAEREFAEATFLTRMPLLDADSSSLSSSSSSSSSLGELVKEAVGAISRQAVRGFASGDSAAARAFRRGVGYVDVQTTRWRDIAGMEAVKATLQALITRSSRERARYREAGVAPSTGVLLYGPPGTGKTMLAKAMATELNAAFLYLDLPELMQSAVGESERRLSEFVALAREQSPAVLFVDELQAAFGVRYAEGGGGRGHSAHDARLVAHFLYLLDEIHTDEDHVVVFVGATNVVEGLDPLVLRPGRLDTHIPVPLPDAHARESLARHVVKGEWGSWLTTPPTLATSDAEGGPVFALGEVLIAEFVRRSIGWSGAELRNAMNVFALKVLQNAEKNRVSFRSEPGDPGSKASALSTALIRHPPTMSCSGEVELSELALRALEDAFKR